MTFLISGLAWAFVAVEGLASRDWFSAGEGFAGVLFSVGVILWWRRR